jgi:chromate transport protein ChrA
LRRIKRSNRIVQAWMTGLGVITIIVVCMQVWLILNRWSRLDRSGCARPRKLPIHFAFAIADCEIVGLGTWMIRVFIISALILVLTILRRAGDRESDYVSEFFTALRWQFFWHPLTILSLRGSSYSGPFQRSMTRSASVGFLATVCDKSNRYNFSELPENPDSFD